MSTTRQWRASFTASRPSGFTIGFMAPAPRPAETSSSISRASTIPAACIRRWATSAQLSLSVWRPNPVHFFGGRSVRQNVHCEFRQPYDMPAPRLKCLTEELGDFSRLGGDDRQSQGVVLPRSVELLLLGNQKENYIRASSDRSAPASRRRIPAAPFLSNTSRTPAASIARRIAERLFRVGFLWPF